jgi:hypothetical protein
MFDAAARATNGWSDGTFAFRSLYGDNRHDPEADIGKPFQKDSLSGYDALSWAWGEHEAAGFSQCSWRGGY